MNNAFRFLNLHDYRKSSKIGEINGRSSIYNMAWHIIFEHTIVYGIFVMAVIIERDGIRYRRTSMEIREDLHAYAREHGVNMSALLNKSLEDKRRGKK